MDAMTDIPLGCIVAGVVVATALIWFVATLNRFIRLRNLIDESWSNVDVVLRRRYDLIPNLVETVKGYAKHEKEALAEVVAARDRAIASTGRVGQQAHDENRLVRSVNHLFARAEAYPQLEASQNFLQLQRELVNTEDRIAAARRFYNANVREHNTLVEQFPSMMVARMMGRQGEEFFEIESLAIRQAPPVSL
jgi:LemA protein